MAKATAIQINIHTRNKGLAQKMVSELGIDFPNDETPNVTAEDLVNEGRKKKMAEEGMSVLREGYGDTGEQLLGETDLDGSHYGKFVEGLVALGYSLVEAYVKVFADRIKGVPTGKFKWVIRIVFSREKDVLPLGSDALERVTHFFQDQGKIWQFGFVFSNGYGDTVNLTGGLQPGRKRVKILSYEERPLSAPDFEEGGLLEIDNYRVMTVEDFNKTPEPTAKETAAEILRQESLNQSA